MISGDGWEQRPKSADTTRTEDIQLGTFLQTQPLTQNHELYVEAVLKQARHSLHQSYTSQSDADAPLNCTQYGTGYIWDSAYPDQVHSHGT